MECICVSENVFNVETWVQGTKFNMFIDISVKKRNSTATLKKTYEKAKSMPKKDVQEKVVWLSKLSWCTVMLPDLKFLSIKTLK